MVLLMIGIILALVSLLLLFRVIAEVYIVHSERRDSSSFRTKKRYPFGLAFLTLFLMYVSTGLLLNGLRQTVNNPYERVGDDQVSIINEDKHLSIEVWLKKDRVDLEDNVRIILKAAVRDSLAIGIENVEIKSDVLGVDKVFHGEGARWGSALGGFMGLSGYERDKQEFLFSTDQLYLTPVVFTMTVNYELAEGSGPSFFQDYSTQSQIDVMIRGPD